MAQSKSSTATPCGKKSQLQQKSDEMTSLLLGMEILLALLESVQASRIPERGVKILKSHPRSLKSSFRHLGNELVKQERRDHVCTPKVAQPLH